MRVTVEAFIRNKETARQLDFIKDVEKDYGSFRTSFSKIKTKKDFDAIRDRWRAIFQASNE